MTFVFFLLPLSPNDAYAAGDFFENEAGFILLGFFVGALIYMVGSSMVHLVQQDEMDKKSVSDKDDKEKVLAEKFAKLNTDKDNGISPKGRVTYPVFEW